MRPPRKDRRRALREYQRQLATALRYDRPLPLPKELQGDAADVWSRALIPAEAKQAREWQSAHGCQIAYCSKKAVMLIRVGREYHTACALCSMRPDVIPVRPLTPSDDDAIDEYALALEEKIKEAQDRGRSPT